MQVIGLLDDVDGRGKQWIEADLQSVLDHGGDYSAEEWAGELETRVGVYLD